MNQKIQNGLLSLVTLAILCLNYGNTSVIVPRDVKLGQTSLKNCNHESAELSRVGLGMEIKDYSCYDVFNKPHIGRIPHPACCNYYVKCISTNGYPIPYLQICTNNTIFDMHGCACVEPSGAELCFDHEQEPIRFKCAKPVALQSFV